MDKLLERLRKKSGVITVPTLGTGQLDPQRQQAFNVMVRNNSKFLSMIRYEVKTQATNKIDKIMLGEPITEPANELTSTTRVSRPIFGQIQFTTQKLRAQYSMSWESLRENLQRRSLGPIVARMVTEKIADDLELLAMQGDEAIVGGGDPTLTLLSSNNGFDKLTDNCHIFDAGGSTITTKLFVEAMKRMPARFRKNLGNLRWFCSPDLKLDYLKVLQGRNTPLGDLYTIVNRPLEVLGIPLIDIPYIPNDKAVSVGTSTPAIVKSTRAEPYLIEKDTNDKLAINVDGAGVVTVTLPEGGRTGLELVSAINQQVGFNVARDDGFGFIVFKSLALGAAGSIAFTAIANDAYSTLGLAVGVTTGQNANPANSINEGSYMLLADPRQFIYVTIDGTRIYSDYEKRTDSYDTVIYLENDFVVENEEGIVKVVNLRINNEY